MKERQYKVEDNHKKIGELQRKQFNIVEQEISKT